MDAPSKHNYRLTAAQVVAMRELHHVQGVSEIEIARTFRISQPMAHEILVGVYHRTKGGPIAPTIPYAGRSVPRG